MTAAAVETVAAEIVDARGRLSPARSVLVGVTGIDGCGKSHLTTAIATVLESRSLRVAHINADGWLNLPDVRFNDVDPAEHFYRHAIRFNDLFTRLVLPLRRHRSVRLDADHAEETATTYRPHLYEFEDIDIVLLEGIYLLKRAFQAHYDLSYWIDCSFDTALERAIARSQEGLPPAATARAYQTIYFPAQVLHLRRDEPRIAATATVNNDPRLASA